MEGNLTQLKLALLKCADENANKTTLTGQVVVSSVCRGAVEAIDYLKKELEKEIRINAEIKVRFVKCNTCTEDMKKKCLMFSENLCEGERCEELVDLMSLVSDRDKDKELEQLKEVLKDMITNSPDTYSGTDAEFAQKRMFKYQAAMMRATELLEDK